MPRLQAIVVRNKRILMVKHRHRNEEWWCLPGGALEANETPEQGVLRELKEECNVEGKVVKLTCYAYFAGNNEAYSFLVDIGNQNPSLGFDPEAKEGKQARILVDVQWLLLSEIPERDRTFLWASGLHTLDDFYLEMKNWGNTISYPGKDIIDGHETKNTLRTH